jgi:uncharacterized SAM-binding protein YcdF (DUF218 family)
VFFLLSKSLDVLLSPLCWALFLVSLGSLAPRLRPPVLARRLRLATPAGLLLLYLFSIDPVSNALWQATEAPPLTSFRGEGGYDAVIVLGGMLDDRSMATFGRASYNDNVDRLLAAHELLRADKVRFALLSGGDGDPAPGSTDEALVLKKQLESWGIEPSRLLVESKSRNTRENAVESAAIWRERGWSRVLLVTSAFHMPRALGCFRALGLEPDTWAVDLRSDQVPRGLVDLLPRTRSLHMSSAALRELAGRLIYRARGYTR